MVYICEAGSVNIWVRKGTQARGVVHYLPSEGPLGTARISVTLPAESEAEKNVHIKVEGNICVQWVGEAPVWGGAMELKLCGKVVRDNDGLVCNGSTEIECLGNTFIKFCK